MRTLTIVLVLFLSSAAAYAEPSAEEKAACEADYKKYCSIVPEDKIPMIVLCLKQNIDKLTEQCRKAVEK